MKHRAVLEVDLSLFKKNCRTLKKLAGDQFFCPMVKADAYGHGAVSIAKALLETGVQQVGVISVDEAWSIREFVRGMDILIFGPVLNTEDMSWILEENLVLVCSHWEDLKILSQFHKPARIHIKFNTGFSRLGFPLTSAGQIIDFLKDNSHIQVEGLATQLVSSDYIGDEKSISALQIKEFLSLQGQFSHLSFHALNTAGLISGFVHEEVYDLGARPGIGLYGLKPKVFLRDDRAKKRWDNLSFFLVSSLKSYIVDLHQLNKGDTVSYGGFWKAKGPSQIATVSLGYGDGFLRAFGSCRNVLFRGKKRPVVGTVCMDFVMIDLTEDLKDPSASPVRIGEEVVVFGRQEKGFLCPEEQAEKSRSISYELFSRLGPRIKRLYKDS